MKTVFKGKIIQVVEKDVGGRSFEIARRSPGVRLVIVDGDKMLLTKEYRHEHAGYDYRLPGGKVFDTLDEFLEHENEVASFALVAAKNECVQETGLIPVTLEHLVTSKAGATIEWDLYYYVVTAFEQNAGGQQLELGEDISVEWKSLEEVKRLCLDGSIKEDRTVGILLKYILRS